MHKIDPRAALEKSRTLLALNDRHTWRVEATAGRGTCRSRPVTVTHASGWAGFQAHRIILRAESSTAGRPRSRGNPTSHPPERRLKTSAGTSSRGVPHRDQNYKARTKVTKWAWRPENSTRASPRRSRRESSPRAECHASSIACWVSVVTPEAAARVGRATAGRVQLGVPCLVLRGDSFTAQSKLQSAFGLFRMVTAYVYLEGQSGSVPVCQQRDSRISSLIGGYHTEISKPGPPSVV